LADIWGLGCPSYCAQPIKAKVRRLFSSGTWEKHCENIYSTAFFLHVHLIRSTVLKNASFFLVEKL
jgi:hypothetical protein